MNVNEKMKIELCAGMNKLVKIVMKNYSLPIRFYVTTKESYYTIYFKGNYTEEELNQNNCDYILEKDRTWIDLYNKKILSKDIKFIFINITAQSYQVMEITTK